MHTAEFRNATLAESGIGPIEKIFNRRPAEVQGDLSRSLSVHTTGQSDQSALRRFHRALAKRRVPPDSLGAGRGEKGLEAETAADAVVLVGR